MMTKAIGAAGILVAVLASPTWAQFVSDVRRTTRVPPAQEFQARKCRVVESRLEFTEGSNTESAFVVLSKCAYPRNVQSIQVRWNRNYPELGPVKNVLARVVPEAVFARWVALTTAAKAAGSAFSVWCDATTKVVGGVAYCSSPQVLGLE